MAVYRSSCYSIVVSWIVYKIIEEKLSPLSKIPSPPGRLPLVGHLFSITKSGGLHKVITEWRDKYGPIIRFGPGFSKDSVIIYQKEFIRQVLISESHRYTTSEFFKKIVPGFGNGILTSSGKAHARQRKLINPAFNLTSLKAFVPAFATSAGELVQLWTRKAKQSSTLEIDSDISHLTLDIIGKTSFGYSFNTILGKETEVSSAFNLLHNCAELAYIVRSSFIPFYKYLPLPDNRAIQKSLCLVNETVMKVIEERRILRQQGKTSDHNDLLDRLFDMYDQDTGAGFDDEELRSQVYSFIFAGHETISTSLSWTLYELARKPEIQVKMKQEIMDVIKDEEVTWAKLDQLEYLTCVIKESLRLHCPASFFGREPKQTLHIGEYEIPKGTSVMIPIDALHMSPDFWEEPLEFAPERFTKSDASPMNQFPFMPFSFGPRICIGYKFAFAEMKTVLLSLMKNFKFAAVPGFNVESALTITTKPDPSVKVQITLLNSGQ